MRMHHLAVLAASLSLAACGSTKSMEVREFKTTDKQLSCSDIMLEMNEAEFFRRKAESNKAMGFKSFVMPIGYIRSYMSAEDAIKAADTRQAYLAQIFEIKKCKDQPQQQQAMAASDELPQAGAQLAALPQPPQAMPQPYYMPAGQMMAAPPGYVMVPQAGYGVAPR